MKIFYSLLFSFLSLISYGQFFDFNKDVEWKGIEYKLSEDEKLRILSKINEDLFYYLKDNNLVKNNLEKFHFVNLNNDNLLDFIYVGYSGAEDQSTIAFIQDEKGNYIKKFETIGVIYEIISISILEPVLQIKIIKNDDCYDCIGVKNSLTYLCINGDFKLIEALSFTKSTTLPSLEFKKRFKVINPKYYLRSYPEIYNEGDKPDVLFGNVIAEYGSGIKGFAFSSQKDETGRTWWFVAIPAKDCSQSIFLNEKGYFLGWMSSNYLEEL